VTAGHVERVELDFAVGMSLGKVSAILLEPPRASWLYVMAHGAGAGMRHPFLEQLAQRLAERGVGTFRYQFPYVEAGETRPDPPPVLEATVLAAVQTAGGLRPSLPLLAGGKSLGGRMTSHLAARQFLPGVRGLVFLGFPLHAPKKLSTTRADHLDQVPLPMLFLQGTRDTLAELELVRTVTGRLGKTATLHVVEGGDHSFKVLKRSGRNDGEVQDELADALAGWASALLPPERR
jgi:predicted alpha/beta-hydrolase family hydrolase